MNSRFRQDCDGIYAQKMELLNENYVKFLKEGNQGAMIAYEGHANKISILYKPPLCDTDIKIAGSNEMCQMGKSNDDKKNYETSKPKRVGFFTNVDIKQFACGASFTVLCDRYGSVYGFGGSDKGTIGRLVTDKVEDETNDVRPQRITGFKPSAFSRGFFKEEDEDDRMIAVAAGAYHSIFLSINGNVYSTGTYRDSKYEEFHDIAPPDQQNVDHKFKVSKDLLGSRGRPLQVLLPGPAQLIEAGGAFSCAVMDGVIYTWGMDNAGEMGRGIVEGDRARVVVEKKLNSNLLIEKFLTPKPVAWPIPGKMNVLSIGCGDCHLVVAAKAGNSDESLIFSCGLNNYGQLCHGDQKNRNTLALVEESRGKQLVDVACGQFHTLFLSACGNAIFACGRSDYGALGTTDTMPSIGDFKKTLQRVAFEKPLRFKSIACGENTSYATSVEGEAYAWGFGESGSLGCGKKSEGPTDEYRPRKMCEDGFVIQVAAGSQHSVLLTSPR